MESDEADDLDELFQEIEERNSKLFTGWFYRHGLFGYTAMHLITRPWVFFECVGREIKWAYQRVFRGWDDRIVWSIDTYLCEMMPQWLEQLKRDKHGVPSMMLKDGDIKENGHVDDEVITIRAAEYDEILDQIIDGFKAHRELDGAKWDDPILKEKYNRGMDLLKTYFGTLWD